MSSNKRKATVLETTWVGPQPKDPKDYEWKEEIKPVAIRFFNNRSLRGFCESEFDSLGKKWALRVYPGGGPSYSGSIEERVGVYLCILSRTRDDPFPAKVRFTSKTAKFNFLNLDEIPFPTDIETAAFELRGVKDYFR